MTKVFRLAIAFALCLALVGSTFAQDKLPQAKFDLLTADVKQVKKDVDDLRKRVDALEGTGTGTAKAVAACGKAACECGTACKCDPATCPCEYKACFKYVEKGKAATLYVGVSKPKAAGPSDFHTAKLAGFDSGIYSCYLVNGEPTLVSLTVSPTKSYAFEDGVYIPSTSYATPTCTNCPKR